MFEQWQYTIAASTPEGSAETKDCPISPGVIKKIELHTMFGCENLARCRVFLGVRPIFPRSPKHYITGNGLPVSTGEISEPVKTDIPILKWVIWNEDETNEHQMTLSVTWDTEEERRESANILKQSQQYLQMIYEKLSGLVG